MAKAIKKKEDKKQLIGVNNYVEHSMAVLDRIHELLDKKFDGRQIELAKYLGKTESEISKWLNGVQNFTLFTISKLEEAFGERIIGVCTDDEANSTFTQVFPSACIQDKFLEVDTAGKMVDIQKFNVKVEKIEFDTFTERNQVPELI